MAGLINYVKKAFKNYPNTTTKISAENLNHLDNGIFDLDQAVKTAIDDINDDINGLNNDLTANNNHFYFDYKNGKYGYNTSAERGADTFSPFKNGGAKLVGTYNSNASINISDYEHKDINHFVAVCTSSKSASETAVNNYQIYSRQHCDVSFTKPSISISGDTLNLTVATLYGDAYVEGYSHATASARITTALYYLGNLETD